MPSRLRRTSPLWALVLLFLSGCFSPPSPPSEWPAEVRASFPAGPVALLGAEGGWIASGVLFHSCPGHGTYALTNRHVARQIADEGGLVDVYVPDLERGTQALYLAEVVAPALGVLLDERGKESNADLFLEDVALLRLRTEKLLPCAPMAIGDVGKDPQRFRVCTIYPEGEGHSYALKDDPRSRLFPHAEVDSRPGESGSGVFDEEGNLQGLLWGSRGKPVLEKPMQNLRAKLEQAEEGSKEWATAKDLLTLFEGIDRQGPGVLQTPVMFVWAWLHEHEHGHLSSPTEACGLPKEPEKKPK